jgi:hypothetical protein
MEEPHPESFVPCPTGGLDFGQVPTGLTIQNPTAAEPIRLQHGTAGAHGWGHRHIIGYESRPKQIEGLGFPSVLHFVHQVATRYTHIYKGKKPNRLQLACHSPSYSYYIIVERVPHGRFWTVITALPSRPIKGQPLWVRPTGSQETGGSEPSPLAPEPRRRFTTLSLPAKPKLRDSSS